MARAAVSHRHLAFSSAKPAVHFYKARPSIAGDLGPEFDESGNKNDDLYRMCAVVAQAVAASASTASLTAEPAKDYGMLMLQYRENNNANHPSNGPLQTYIEALKNDTSNSLHGNETVHPSLHRPNRAQRVQKRFKEQCQRRWYQMKRWPVLSDVVVDPTRDDVQQQLRRLEKERQEKLQDSVQLDPADLARYWKLKQLEDEMLKVHQRRRPKLNLKWGKPSEDRRAVAVEQHKRRSRVDASGKTPTDSLDVRESLIQRSEEISARNAATERRASNSSASPTPAADAGVVSQASENSEQTNKPTTESAAVAPPPPAAGDDAVQSSSTAAVGSSPTATAVEQTVTTITDWMKPELSDEHNTNVSSALFWNDAEVAKWLDGIGMSRYAHAFQVNGIVGNKLINVKASSLPSIGVRNWSHIKQITAGLRELLKIQKIRLPVSIADHPADPMQLYLEIKSRDGFLGDQLTYERFLNHLPKLSFAPELSLLLQRK